MTTRKRVTAKDGEQAIAMLGRERAATERTGYATEMRRCIGSERFGIEAHEAAVSTFPVQPSRPDGLGLMCAEHWKAYVKGLREARVPADGKAAAKVTRLRADEPAAGGKATTKRERRRTPMAHVPDPKVVEAEALVREVDARPRARPARRARRCPGRPRDHRQRQGGGTGLGEAIDGGTEEADAA